MPITGDNTWLACGKLQRSSAAESNSSPHACAGTELMSAAPLQTPFDKKKAAVVGLRKWVRFAKNGDTTIMQVCRFSA